MSNTNIVLLNSLIENSGLKKKYIASQANLTAEGLNNKLKGKREFTGPEMQSIASTLRLSNDEIMRIFFPQFVE